MTGKHLYCIHGMCGSGDDPYWANYRQFFQQQGYTVHTPTLPFHDQPLPDKALGKTGLADYITFLKQDMAGLPEKPVVLGHSMGGWLALKLAEEGLTEKAVLVTPATPAGIFNSTPGVVRCFMPGVLQPAFWNRPFKFSFATCQYGIYNQITDNALQNALYAGSRHESGRVAFELGFWPVDPKNASKIDMENISIPVLLLAGGRDRITPHRGIAKIAACLPHSSYYFYQQHAHGIMWESDWPAVARDILEWLQYTKN